MVFKRRRHGKNLGKKAYVKRKKVQRKEIKRETDKDIAQDFQLNKLSKQVSKLTKAEKGWVTFATTSNTWTSIPTILAVTSNTSMAAWVFQNLVGISQGDTQLSRQGDYINVQRINIRYQLRTATSAPNTQNGLTLGVRVMVVCFLRPNGTPAVAGGSLVPTFDDLFAYSATSATMARGNIMQLFNPDQRNVYRVYYDRYHILPDDIFTSGTSNDVTHATSKPYTHGFVSIRPTKKNSTVIYNNTTGNLVDIQENMWVMLVFSDNSTTADASPPQVSIQSLVEYQQ